ncbi:MAG: hypothetical protein K5754_03575 [Butyrivibrio sp.]|jgi:hypothetical protein|nr:hypothetical protein [Butyrivibrio sp.]MCR4635288.1 hypothetical protein [Butyrivibrio sp.]
MDKELSGQEKETIRKYSDIIDAQRPVSLKHPAMDSMKRAAQFSPFAALTGYEDTVESARDRFVKDLEYFGEHMENIED